MMLFSNKPSERNTNDNLGREKKGGGDNIIKSWKPNGVACERVCGSTLLIQPTESSKLNLCQAKQRKNVLKLDHLLSLCLFSPLF